MKASEAKILKRIKKIVKDKEPSSKIYLYGSRSRGTAINRMYYACFYAISALLAKEGIESLRCSSEIWRIFC